VGAAAWRQDRRRRAERDAEQIFDMSLDLLCIVGFDGYFKRVSPAFERTLGYPSATLLSRPLLEFVHPEDRERTRQRTAMLRRGGKQSQFENRYVRSDGSVRWLQWNTRPVPEEGVMYAAGRDVTESRGAAEEQAALRRVATLVARGVPPAEIFDAVASETRRVLDVDACGLLRLESDGSVTVLAADSTLPVPSAVGERLMPEAGGVLARILRPGGSPRIEPYEGAPGAAAERARSIGLRGLVGAPIVVEGRRWGFMVAAWAKAHATPPGSEDRLLQFTELLATAIANAQSRAELTASRARVVDAADEARRRIERDLHDGVQQRLVVLGLQVRAATELVAATSGELRDLLLEISEGLISALDDLRELSLGIHPAILRHGGLRPAIRALARRSAVPVEVDMPQGLRLPERVEVAAYYVVSEALTNVAKHSQASVVEISAAARDGFLELAIRDDGVGGATSGAGTGLIGLTDRVEAVGGSIRITSPPGGGTTLRVTVPAEPPASGVAFARARATPVGRRPSEHRAAGAD
jgi:PAS domain S-box-containing protein